jgi:uncharacterized protein (DUF2164 family)
MSRPPVGRKPVSQRKIEFSKPETAAMVGELRRYFVEELDSEIGQLPAEMMVEFIAQKLGVYFYNRGLYDAQQLLNERMADVSDQMLALEFPTGTGR